MTTYIKNSGRASLRSRLMVGTSAALVTAALATPAHAQSVIVDTNLYSDVVAHQSIGSGAAQLNNAGVTAEVRDAAVGITRTGTSSGTSDAATANQIIATARGNAFTYDNPNLLGLISGPGGDGVAMSGASLNYGNVTSLVEDGLLSVNLTDLATGSVTNSDNTIAAKTVVNAGTSTINGATPVGYSSNQAGAVMTDANGWNTNSDLVIATGSAAAVTVQVNEQRSFSDSSAAEDNGVSLTLGSSGTNVVNAAAQLDGNDVTASFAGNSASSLIALDGDDGSFAGSAVIGTTQLNAHARSSGNAAVNNYSNIQADIVGQVNSYTNTLGGSLSVSDNAIVADASGNAASSLITLADQLAFTGSDNTAPVPGSVANISAGVSGANAYGSLAIATNQQTDGFGEDYVPSSTLKSLVYGANIDANVQQIFDGSITVGGNAITATARGNNAYAGIASGDGSAAFDGTAAIVLRQENLEHGVDARVTNSSILLNAGDNWTGEVDSSALSLLNNDVSAKAQGNTSVQSLDLNAATLALASGNAVLVTDGMGANLIASANGPATITSVQSNQTSPVSAGTFNSLINLYSDDEESTTDSSLIVSGNSQQAIALGSDAANALSLTGVTVGSGAGIASLQRNDNASPVSAQLGGVEVSAAVQGELGGGSSLELSNNLQRAIAYGGAVDNTLDVNSTTLTIDEAGTAVASTYRIGTDLAGFALDDNDAWLPTVNAGYGVLNNQHAASDVSASVQPSWSAVMANVDSDVEVSSVDNKGNAVIAAAYANQAANRGTLAIGDLGVTQLTTWDEGTSTFVPVSGMAANVASLTNLQTLHANADVTASLHPGTVSGGATVLTWIEDDSWGSSVSTSDNLLQAVAVGNRAIGTNPDGTARAGNLLSVSGTSIATGDGVGGDSGTLSFAGIPVIDGAGSLASVDASFTLQNAQVAQAGTTLASQRGIAEDADRAANILTFIDDRVSSSSILSLGNRAIASATSNLATNGVELSATTLEATAGLQNYQALQSRNTVALLGAAGTPGSAGTPDTPAVPFTYGATATGLMANCVSSICDVTAGTLSVDPTGLTPAQIAYLDGLSGWSQVGSNLEGPATSLETMTLTEYAALVEGTTTTLAGTIPMVPGTPATPAIPNQGGVSIAVGGWINDSVLRVSDNTGTASAIGNDATNALSVAATTLQGGGSNTIALADLSASVTSADYVVQNAQEGTGGLTAEAFQTFSIDTGGSGIDASQLEIVNNKQRAEVIGNSAGNSLSLAATTQAGTSAALSSLQSGAFTSLVTSDMEVFTPVVSDNSSIAVTGNSNTASGALNLATNEMSVSGTNLGSVSGLNGAYNSSGTSADYVVSNVQIGSGSLTTNAATRIYNQDTASDTGVDHGSVSFSNNATASSAVANSAANSLTLDASAVQSASGALTNFQTSGAAVAANAQSTIGVAVTGSTGTPGFPALNASNVALNGNSTTALARGNAATNAMVSSAGAGYATSGAGAGTDGYYASAANVVTNMQNNSGAISAQAQNTSYSVALNGAAGTPGVLNSSVSINGNNVAAAAYGNVANNSLTLAALNGGTASGAVNNTQHNTGPIFATATSVTYSFNGSNGSTGSTFRNTGNAITATAVGNSAVSSITGR